MSHSNSSRARLTLTENSCLAPLLRCTLMSPGWADYLYKPAQPTLPSQGNLLELSALWWRERNARTGCGVSTLHCPQFLFSGSSLSCQLLIGSSNIFSRLRTLTELSPRCAQFSSLQSGRLQHRWWETSSFQKNLIDPAQSGAFQSCLLC